MRRLALLMAVMPAVALAQTVYTWEDAEGVQHFTDDRASIPPGVKVRTTEGEAISQVIAGRSTTPADAGPAVTEIVVSEELDEQAWRQVFLQARQAVVALEDEVELDRRKVEEVNGMPITHQVSCAPVAAAPGGRPFSPACVSNVEFERAKLRLARNRKALEQAKEALADLERKASFEAVPQEWRR